MKVAISEMGHLPCIIYQAAHPYFNNHEGPLDPALPSTVTTQTISELQTPKHPHTTTTALNNKYHNNTSKDTKNTKNTKKMEKETIK